LLYVVVAFNYLRLHIQTDLKVNRKTIIALLSVLLAFTASGQTRWTLESCIARAFEKNISIKQSQLNVDLAEINQKNAMGNLLPSLNGQASHGYNWGQRIDPFTNQFATERIRSNSFGISTSVNLFSGFQARNSLEQAHIDVMASRLNNEKARNDIALNIASLYLAILMNQEMVTIARSNSDNTGNQAKRITILVNAGQLAQNNLDDINAQMASDQATLVQAENTYNLSVLNLAQQLQLTSEETSTFRISSPDLSAVQSASLPPSAEAAVQYSLTHFPEMKSAEYNMQSADVGVEIAKGAALPSLSASFSYGTGYSGAASQVIGDPDFEVFPIGLVQATGDVVVSAQPIYGENDFETISFADQLTDNVNKSLFFSLNIPIFNGFSTESNIKRSEVNRLSAEYSLEATSQTLRQSVERAYADALAAKANYDASNKAVEASERAFRNSESRYEQGAATQVEYSDARTRLDNAKVNSLNNKYDYLFRLRVLEFYEGRAITLNP